MTSSDGSNNFKDIFQKLDYLVGRAAANHGSNDEVSAALNVALKELNAAAEEMRKQSSMLAEARSLAEAEKRRLGDLFDSMPEGYIVTDSKGKITRANKAAGALLAVKAQNLSGKPFMGFVSRESRGTLFSEMDMVNASYSMREIEIRITPRGKPSFFASVKITPVLNDSTNIPSSLRWVIRDITQSKETQQRLADSVATLARNNIELEQFAYLAAHDLKEPLRIINTYSQLLGKDKGTTFSPDGQVYFSTICESISKMISLVDDVLMYSSSTSGGETALVDISAAVNDAIKFNALKIKETKASVKVRELPRFMVPETRCTQVIRNLLGNALKFRGAETPEVVISAKTLKDGLSCSIQDNGIGIEEEYSDRIFEMFQRLHSDNEYAGNGIGLAICKKIVASWGGEITVKSELGKGSKFTFSVPHPKSA